MKKSFLKRVAAAAIAVPVALTQTALFTSFAADDTAKTTTISIDTFRAIKPDATRTKKITEDNSERYAVKEAKNEYAYVQESAWNEKLELALDSLADGTTRSIDAGELLDAVNSDNDYVKLVKAAADRNNTTATVTVNRNEVVVSFDIVLDVRAGIQEIADQNGVDMTFPDKGKYDVTLVLTADTRTIGDKIVPFGIKFLKTGTTEAATLDESIAYVQDRLQELKDYGYGECDKKEAEGNTDAPVMREKLDSVFSKFDKLMRNALSYLEDAKKGIAYDYTAADIDDLYGQIRDDAVNSRLAGKSVSINGNEYSVDSIPATIEEALSKDLYSTFVKYFVKAINRANETLAEKSYEISVTDEEIIAFLKSGSDFEVSAETANLVTDFDALFYVPDDDFDEEFYVEFFENEITAGNIEVPAGKALVSAESVKVVDGFASVDADVVNRDRGLDGAVEADVYRVVWPVFEDEEPSESSTDESNASDESNDSSEESNPGESDSSEESNPDESDNSEESNTDDTKNEVNPNDVTIDVATDQGFYFTHDTSAFDPQDLIKEYTVEGDEDAEVVWDHFVFGYEKDQPIANLSPMNVYLYYYLNATSDGYKYNVAKPLYIFYDNADDDKDAQPVMDQNGEQATAYVYIGVKGDTDLSGETNVTDATNVLIYAAARGAGETPVINADYSEVIERFAYFLADTDTESRNGYSAETPLNVSDATNIRIFAARRGSTGDYYLDAQGKETTADAKDAVPFANVNWIDEVSEEKGVLSPEYPEYSLKIAKNAGLVK